MRYSNKAHNAFRAADNHARFFVADDGHGAPCLWRDTVHAPADCDACDAIYGTGLMWGPDIVLVKEDTAPAVWWASVSTLTNLSAPSPVRY